jgi:hypothetical protein
VSGDIGRSDRIANESLRTQTRLCLCPPLLRVVSEARGRGVETVEMGMRNSHLSSHSQAFSTLTVHSRKKLETEKSISKI